MPNDPQPVPDDMMQMAQYLIHLSEVRQSIAVSLRDLGRTAASESVNANELQQIAALLLILATDIADGDPRAIKAWYEAAAGRALQRGMFAK